MGETLPELNMLQSIDIITIIRLRNQARIISPRRKVLFYIFYNILDCEVEFSLRSNRE